MKFLDISVEIDVPIEDCLFNLSDGSYALGLKLFSDDAEAWFVELPFTKCGLIDNNGSSPTITNYHYDPVHLPSTGSTGIIATLQSAAALCAVGITGALLSKRRSKKTESYKPKHLSKK